MRPRVRWTAWTGVKNSFSPHAAGTTTAARPRSCARRRTRTITATSPTLICCLCARRTSWPACARWCPSCPTKSAPGLKRTTAAPPTTPVCLSVKKRSLPGMRPPLPPSPACPPKKSPTGSSTTCSACSKTARADSPPALCGPHSLPRSSPSSRREKSPTHRPGRSLPKWPPPVPIPPKSFRSKASSKSATRARLRPLWIKSSPPTRKKSPKSKAVTTKP